MFIRALIFFFGLLMLSTGISVITHAGLGTGTISSVALVLSKVLPLSMGFFVFLTNVFFFVLQTAVDPSRFLVKLVKQIPICFVFGLFFDAAYALTSFVAPAAYLEQLATVFIGTVFNGMGIAGMVFARLAILPPEGLVISIIRRWGGSFGNLRRHRRLPRHRGHLALLPSPRLDRGRARGHARRRRLRRAVRQGLSQGPRLPLPGPPPRRLTHDAPPPTSQAPSSGAQARLQWDRPPRAH